MNSIFLALSPNVEKDDFFLALKILFQPWRWRGKEAVRKLESAFKEFLGVEHAFAFSSGRTGLVALLDGMGIEEGSEVLVQGLTCNALINPLIWSGLYPRYVDIKEETLNMDPVDLERKINRNSRAVVVQHTFGLPAEMGEIRRICRENDLLLIEDCAHSLGAEWNGRQTGTLGRAAFFSLGRSKVLSSVQGGVAVTDDPELARRIKAFRQGLEEPSLFRVGRQLLHPILTQLLIKPLYSFSGIGRLLLVVFQRLGVLSKAVRAREKKGKRPTSLFTGMANGLALLGLNQMEKIERFLFHQKKLAGLYREELQDLDCLLPRADKGRIYLRFSVLMPSPKPDRIREEGRKENIFLNDGWHTTPVVPLDTDQKKMKYFWGACPVAERTARKVLNLPTNINVSSREARRLVNFLKKNL